MNKNVFTIELLPRPLVGGVSFAVNGQHLNPTIYLRSGEDYKFQVNSNALHGFVIKYSNGGVLVPYAEAENNGTYLGEINLSVTAQTPRQLIYQSSSEPGIVGLILVDAEPYALENGVQLLRTDGYADGVDELIDKVNHNSRLFLTINDRLAGAGLKLDGRTLLLDCPESTIYYQDVAGQVIRSDELFSVNDQTTAAVAATLSLQTTLDLIAKQIRQIKDPAQGWGVAASENLKSLGDRISSLQQNAEALNRKFSKLKSEVAKRGSSNG